MSQELRSKLLQHPLYSSLQRIDDLRLFMREHVFAVWDFMSLLKRLQRMVTCSDILWIPTPDASLVRFINEILLGEECDEDGRGGYSSHFELYLAAMDEVGADTRPIRVFIKLLRKQVPVDQALNSLAILPTTRQFVQSTLHVAMYGKPHEVAAAFFYGREDLISDMFSRFIEALPANGCCVDRLRHYLHRHVELDKNEHGPLAKRLLEALSDFRDDGEAEASAIYLRISLWDGILHEI
ncbi:MAG: DUF3050 domain-containing protein [Schlesneria sp.]